MKITHEAPEFDERNRTGLFYSQSWLLTHMLMLGEPYARQFGQFAQEVSNSGSSEGAFQKIYGKGLAEVERDLQAYYRSQSLKGVLYDAKLQKIEVAEPTAPTELETELTLTKLVALLGRRDEAMKRYSALAKTYPDQWEIHEGIGHLYWRAGDKTKAKESLRRAVELKSPSWKTYWDYARLGHGEEPVIDALTRALELNPGLSEARMLLGVEYNNAHRYQEAYDTFSTIKDVTPDRAVPFYLAKAYCAMQLSKKSEARSAAEMAKKYAKDPAELAKAQEYIDFLDRPLRTESREIASTSSQPAGSTITQDSEIQIVRGSLQEVECFGKESRLTVTSGTSKFPLLIRDADSIRIKSSNAPTVNLTCGLQRSLRVIVGIRVKADAKFKTMGDVVSLEFQ